MMTDSQYLQMYAFTAISATLYFMSCNKAESSELKEYIGRLVACRTSFRGRGKLEDGFKNLVCMSKTLNDMTNKQVDFWDRLLKIFPKEGRDKKIPRFEQSIQDYWLPDEKQSVFLICRKVFKLEEKEAQMIVAALLEAFCKDGRRAKIVTPSTLVRDLKFLNQALGFLKTIKWDKFEFRNQRFYFDGKKLDRRQFRMCSILALQAMIFTPRNRKNWIEMWVRQFLQKKDIDLPSSSTTPEFTTMRSVKPAMWEWRRDAVTPSLNIDRLFRATNQPLETGIWSCDAVLHEFLEVVFPCFRFDVTYRLQINDILDCHLPIGPISRASSVYSEENYENPPETNDPVHEQSVSELSQTTSSLQPLYESSYNFVEQEPLSQSGGTESNRIPDISSQARLRTPPQNAMDRSVHESSSGRSEPRHSNQGLSRGASVSPFSYDPPTPTSHILGRNPAIECGESETIYRGNILSGDIVLDPGFYPQAEMVVSKSKANEGDPTAQQTNRKETSVKKSLGSMLVGSGKKHKKSHPRVVAYIPQERSSNYH